MTRNCTAPSTRQPQTLITLLVVMLCTTSLPIALSNVHAQDTTSTTANTPLSTQAFEGFAQPVEDVVLSSEEMGRLVEVPVKLGQAVKKGQVVARLEDALEAAAVEIARLQSTMVGEIEAAQATVAMQEQRRSHFLELAANDMAGSEEMRRAEVEWKLAQARLVSAQEQQELRKAELARLKIQLQRRKLHAPFDGLVAEKLQDAGSTVTPTSSQVIRLIRVNQLLGEFNISAQQIASLHVGMKAEVFFRAARKTVDGVVDSIAPVINGESGTVLIHILIENHDGLLRPGDRCTMRLIPDKDQDTPSISQHKTPTRY